jgi:uncharacterized OB-fold protein
MIEGFRVDLVVNSENAEYYRYLKRGEFRLQCCSKCGFVRQPASWICPECLSEDYVWKRMSGRASVQTFIWYFEDVLDTRYIQGWSWRDVPYNVAIVRLEEGPQLITNIDDISVEELKAGQDVVPKFVEISAEYAILRFVPASRSGR